jgi:hypothetical protein
MLRKQKSAWVCTMPKDFLVKLRRFVRQKGWDDLNGTQLGPLRKHDRTIGVDLSSVELRNVKFLQPRACLAPGHEPGRGR